MIKQTKSYQTSDGSVHPTIEEAQRHEIFNLLQEQTAFDEAIRDRIAEEVIKQRDRIVDILTTGPRSRPSRRKVNGFTLAKARKARESQKTEAT